LSSPPSDRTYPVGCLPQAKIIVDGRADEPDWALAHVENGFVFPWKRAAAPLTEFRALYDDAFLYFTFRVHDADVVVLDTLRDKRDVVLEDRVEMFFSRDDRMSEYYAIEIDPLGRTYDYRGAYYRQFDSTWTWCGLETKGTLREHGYEVEGRIPLASFESLGFPQLGPGVKIRCGLYRAEFSHDRSGRPVVQQDSMHTQGRRAEGPPPIEDWISWIDPGTPQPDFHVPTSLGWLEIVP
jgi:hypothetical protein